MALTKENGLNLLSNCEGYHQMLKGIHWQADNKSEHLLADDMDSSVLDFEDKMAENIMGYLGEKFRTGELKTMLPESDTLKTLLDEMENDIISFIEEIGDDKKLDGIINIIDDFLEDINKWKYLATLR